MTRKEAIRELSYIADEMPSMEYGDWKEAIYIAIKALKFVDKMHQLRTDYNDYKISQDERIKAEVDLFKEIGI